MGGKKTTELDSFEVNKRIIGIMTEPRQAPTEMKDKDLAKQSVTKALAENELIDVAMRDLQKYNLEVTDKARLEAAKGRNLAHVLLNNHRYRKDSDEMQAVKKALSALSLELEKPLEFEEVKGDTEDPNLTQEERKGFIGVARQNANKMFEIEQCYTVAINACSNYLLNKTPGSDKGIERYKLVRENRQNLVNELNHLKNAKQLVWRGYIGKKPVTPQNLIIEEKNYIVRNKHITDAQKKIYNDSDKRLRTYYTIYDRYDLGEDKLSKEGDFLKDVLMRQALPNAMVENYGEKKKEREKAAKIVCGIWEALSRFEEGTFQTVTMHVGGETFSLFQKEDNTLDLIYFKMHTDKWGQKIEKTVVKNLNISARKLATALGKNMIEYEDIFGTEQSTKILNYTKDVDNDSDFNDNSNASEIGISLLSKRLGLTNVDFTNIPAGEILKKAKELDAGQLTADQVKTWAKEYEYGDKQAKRQKRDEEIRAKEFQKETMNTARILHNEKTLDEVLKEEDEQEELRDLSEEENEELMKKGGTEKLEDESIKEQTDKIVEEEIKALEKEDGVAPVSDEILRESLVIRKAWEDQLADAASKYKSEVDAVREEERKKTAGPAAELEKLKKEQEKALQDAIDMKYALVRNIEEKQEQIKGRIEELNNEYNQKLLEHEEKKNSEETIAQKEEDSAKYIAATNELFDIYQAKLDEIDKRLSEGNEDGRLTEEEADKLKVEAGQDYITKKMELTDGFIRLREQWDAEPAEFEEIRKKIEELTAEVTKTDLARVDLIVEAEKLSSRKKTDPEMGGDGKQEAEEAKKEDIKKDVSEEDIKTADEKLRELDEKIKTEEAKITAINMSANETVKGIEARELVNRNTLEKGMNNELSMWDAWLNSRKRVRPGETALSFEEWKQKQKESYEKHERDRIEREAEEKEHADMVKEFRNLTLDIKELKEKDLSTTTSEKVNGMDTLNLLKHRDKIVAENRLDKLILHTEKIEAAEQEKQDKETERQAEDARKQLDAVNKRIEECRRLSEEEDNKNYDLLDNQTFAIGWIEEEQKKLSEKIGTLSLEYEEKYAEYMEYLQSPEVLKEKEEATARYLAQLEELENSYHVEQEKLGEGFYDNEEDNSQEQELQRLLEGDYISKKAEIEEEFSRKSVKWEKESPELTVLREYIEKLTADTALLEETRQQHIAEYEKIENLYKEDRKAREETIKNLEKERIEHQKTVEAGRRLRERKEAEKRRAAKEKEEKQKAIEEGREWSEEEERLKNFVADFIYSSSTWDMDNETKPGERIWNLISKNRGILAKLASDKTKANKLLRGFASKLPLELLGVSENDISEMISKAVEYLNGVALNQVKEREAEIAERDKAREEWKKNEEKRKIEWENRQEQRRKEWEAAKEAREAKEEEEFQKFLEEHKEFASLSREEGKKKFKSHKDGKKVVDSVSNVFGGFMNFFGLGSEKEEEKPKEKDFLSEEEFKEEEFVEGKYEDPYAKEDWVFKQMSVENRIIVGINMAADVPFEELGEMSGMLEKLVKTEKEIEETVHKQLREVQRTLTKVVRKNLGGNEKEEKTEDVAYYREKGISSEERENRIIKGNEQLDKMLNNAMVGKEGQGQYLRNILSSYLTESSTLDLRSMISSAIRNAKPSRPSKDATDEQKNRSISSWLGGVFKGAGPLLQKTLQGMPENLIPKGLEEAFSDMKDNLASIPAEIVEAQLLAMIERSEGQISAIEIVKSLGAASVGQAFLCKVHMKDGKERSVVVKLLRPDVRNRMLREEKIMRKCAAEAGEGMLRTFEGQMERIREELDLTIEAKNCERGALYDMADHNVKAMKVSRIVEPTANSLMVEQAEGDTVTGVLRKAKKEKEDSLKDYYVYDDDGNLQMDGKFPKLDIRVGDSGIQKARTAISNRLYTLRKQQSMLVETAQKWVTEAVFGNGFYHGDLHSGNIMMDEKSLTIIDFGNATQLTKFQQEKVTQLLLAAAAGSGEGFMEGFKGLLSERSRELLATKGEELLNVFKEVMHLGDARSAAMRIGAALVRAQKLGFELPGAIYGFQQCQMRLQNTIDEFNKEISELQDAMTKLRAADGESKFDVAKKYAKESDAGVRRATMLTLMPTKSEDFRALLKDSSAQGRNAFDSLFDRSYQGLSDMVSLSFEEWKTFLVDDKNAKVIIKQNSMDKFFGIENIMSEFRKFIDAEGEDAKKAVYESLIRKFKAYDVRGFIKELRTAQDNGESPEVLKRYEDNVISAIEKVRESYFGVKRENDNAAREEIRKKREKDPKQKYDEKAYDEDNCYGDDLETLVKPLKENLKDVKLKAQAEAEFKIYFEDEKFGAKLKGAFNAYYDALEKNESEETKERLMNEFIEALRVPLIVTLQKAESLKAAESEVDYTRPDDFLTVMQYVISEKWKSALHCLNIGDAIKYAWRINEDLTGKRLSIKDILKIMAT